MLQIQYFLYFGVLGIVLPYFNLYCYHLGLSKAQIGLVAAVKSITMVIFPIAWGLVADRFNLRKPIFIFCSAVACLVFCGYFFSASATTIAIVTFFYGVFFAPLISFMETFTMDMLGRQKRHYGRVRLWGSISFILVALLIGPVLDHYPIRIILVLILSGSLIQTLSAFGIRAPRAGKRQAPGFSLSGAFRDNRQAVRYLAAAFLMLASHGGYYGFLSIHLDRLGVDNMFISAAWALSAGAEIFVMYHSDKLIRRLTVPVMLQASIGLAAVRWLILALTNNLWLIMTSQLLHAATYGAFHVAGILYIDRLSRCRAKTVGQAINNATAYGLGLAAGTVAAGILYEAAGATTMFAACAVTALAALALTLWPQPDGRR